MYIRFCRSTNSHNGTTAPPQSPHVPLHRPSPTRRYARLRVGALRVSLLKTTSGKLDSKNGITILRPPKKTNTPSQIWYPRYLCVTRERGGRRDPHYAFLH